MPNTAWDPSVPLWKKNLQNWQSGQNSMLGGGAAYSPTPPATPAPTSTTGTTVATGQPQVPAGVPANYSPPSVGDQHNSGAMKGGYERGAYDLYQKYLLPLLQKQLASANLLEPQRQSLVNLMAHMQTPEGQAQLENEFRTQAIGQGTAQGLTNANMLKGQGVSTSGQRGAMIQAGNDATTLANKQMLGDHSLAGQVNAATNGLNFIQKAQSPDLSNFQGVGSDIYDKPNAISHGGSLTDIIGEAAGLATGGGFDFGKLFGGGGGANPISGSSDPFSALKATYGIG